MDRLGLPGEGKRPKSQQKIDTAERMDSIQGLVDALPKVVEQQADTSRRKSGTAKTRQNSNKRDISQFSAVLAHPAFQANPFSAITQHAQHVATIKQEEKAKQQALSVPVNTPKDLFSQQYQQQKLQAMQVSAGQATADKAAKPSSTKARSKSTKKKKAKKPQSSK
eukprot:g38811.t1